MMVFKLYGYTSFPMFYSETFHKWRSTGEGDRTYLIFKL